MTVGYFRGSSPDTSPRREVKELSVGVVVR